MTAEGRSIDVNRADNSPIQYAATMWSKAMQVQLPRADRVLIAGFSPATLARRGRPVKIQYMTNITCDEIARREGDKHMTSSVPCAGIPGVAVVIPQPDPGDSVLSLTDGLVRNAMRLASDPITAGVTA